MEALRFDPDANTFGLEKIQVPKVEADDDVLIEVKYAGLCGTDIHIVKVNLANLELQNPKYNT